MSFPVGLQWKVAVSALCAVSILILLAVTLFPQEFLDNFLGFIVVQPIVLLTLILFGLRSRFGLESRFPLRKLIEANGFAIALSALLPVRAGEFVKPWVLGRTARVPSSAGVALVFVERFFDGFVVFSIAAALAYRGIFSPTNTPTGFLLITLVVVAVMIAGALLFSTSFRGFVRSVAISAIKTMSDAHSVIALFLSTVAIWAAGLSTMVVFGWVSGHEELDLEALVIIFVAATIGSVVGITPGGWGIVDGIMVGLLVLYGLELGEAVSFAVTFRLAVLALPVSLAFAPAGAIIRQGIDRRDG